MPLPYLPSSHDSFYYKYRYKSMKLGLDFENVTDK